MEILILAHSYIRWVILLLLAVVLIMSLQGMISKRTFSNTDNKLSLFLMISAHTQLLVGIILYCISPKVQFGNTSDKMVRFFTMEHSVMMILAIVFITLARILSKKTTHDPTKFRRLFIFNLIALVIIFMAIPWSFSPMYHP